MDFSLKLYTVKPADRNSGTEFTTCFTLGGFLHPYRTLNEDEKKSLEQTKEKTRQAAGVSIHPPEWATTLKDHRLWRLMDKDEVTPLKELIRLVDTSAHTELTEPKTESFHGKDSFTDAAYMEAVENTLHDALNSARISGDENAMVKGINAHYKSRNFDKKASNKFVKKTWKIAEGLIERLEKWETLGEDQKTGIGLWCLHMGLFRI
ncbi:uncharacterized protein LY89DRAFT_785357 [Mollisia scopiformis]|uniref:Uncharacterized protein n=1 Tax=Mollisia scopiformis TaxID=149040 RepID=A0A194WXS0_MOLSC|nr:uncharacterized protein LY89DRAFT_785357 [Mollisia scopiformis]KUJ12776.1 hypothetical protein LY89DRAFT_785357 [Mollisia scopiformis]